MRPLTLTVKGLHSFREKQTIDFATLCEGGVFGIFGPTGSGKSSILDAMTLALYGKVERATNNTQGILNHGEDELYVSFSFQLGHGKNQKTYEVERSFKRAGDIQIRAATCRFIEGTEERIVLADKTSDVNKAVENLLGLSIDDFTRAVVLPQGKFSEFLSLKGAERRQMLQRIFHLEKYGDKLNAKIKHHLLNTKHEKELVETEQNTLGNASQEAVEETKEQLHQITQKLADGKKEQESLEKQLSVEKEIFSLQEEKNQAEQALEQLLEKKEEIEKNTHIVKRAKEANVLFPYISDVENSLKEIEKNKQQVAEATEQLTRMKVLVNEANDFFQQIKEKKNKDEPVLRLKLDQLAQLKKEEQELLIEKDKLNSLENDVEKLRKAILELDEEKIKATNDLKKYENKRMELQDQLNELLIPSDEKRLIFKGTEEKQAIETLIPQLNELAKEIEQVKKKAVSLNEDTKKWEKVVQETERQLLERFQQIYQWYERVCEEERELNQNYHLLSTRKQELQERNKHILITELRKELKNNEPCPVCGSTEHSHGEVDEHGDELLETDEIKSLALLLNDLDQGLRSLERVKWQLEDHAKKLSELVQGEKLTSFSGVKDDGDLLVSRRNGEQSFQMESFSQAWNEKRNLMMKEQEAISQLFQQIELETKEYRSHIEQLKDNKGNVNRANEQFNEFKEKYERLQQEYEEKKEEWKKSYPSFDFETITEIREEVQKSEAEAEKIRVRIDNSAPHIQGKQEEIEQITNKIQEGKIKESALASELKQRKNSFAEKEQRIIDAVGTEKIDELLERTNNELQTLQSDYEKAEADWNQKREEVGNVEKQLVSFEEALRQAEEWNKRAVLQWQQEVVKTSFQSKEEVLAAMLDDEQLKSMEVMLEKYNKEKQTLQLKLQNVKEKLADRSVTEEKINETSTLLLETKERIERLGEEKGKLEGMLEDLKEKVKRFEELEKVRLQLVDKYSKYEKLDQVFRGKAFVEFIAEEQLIQVSRIASERLYTLTRGRYALEVDSNGGFVIRDDANGGVKRPVSTLSGGETFLTSLALALSLSTSIQLKGQHPLEFFFLDEGFGTLDPDLLEIVISALEKLHTDKLAVGVISHVPELKERLPRKITVIPAEPGGRGSRVVMETL